MCCLTVEIYFVFNIIDLDIDNIVYTIHNCASSGIVVQEWYCLAIALDVDGFKKKELRKRYQEDMLDSYALFDSILKHWRSKENNKATMKLLLEAVEKCEWIDLAGNFFRILSLNILLAELNKF